jgi:hypothetical protein
MGGCAQVCYCCCTDVQLPTPAVPAALQLPIAAADGAAAPADADAKHSAVAVHTDTWFNLTHLLEGPNFSCLVSTAAHSTAWHSMAKKKVGQVPTSESHAYRMRTARIHVSALSVHMQAD